MGDMLDAALGVGSAFDWISPVAGFLGDLLNGPSHTFLIPWAGCPLNGREISQLLGRRGVRFWGLMIVSGTLMVSVRLNQARWAQHLLEQAGVPIENPLPGSGSTRSPGAAGRRPGPRAAAARRSRILRMIEGRR